MIKEKLHQIKEMVEHLLEEPFEYPEHCDYRGMYRDDKNMLRYSKVRDVKDPIRANPNDAGFDLFIPNDIKEPYVFNFGDTHLIASGLHFNVPKGFMLMVQDKSGIAVKKGLKVGAKIIDEGYQGEVLIHLTKIIDDDEPSTLNPGDKFVQVLMIPVSYALLCEQPYDTLYPEKSGRGEGGFGSTGEK